jgi:hypothetical protein
MIDQAGMILIARNNPIALYTSASYRKVSDPVDRVYGIMQVFGYQLGATGEKIGTARKITGLFTRRFTPIQLERQLSKKLLEQYPVQSQLHIFTVMKKMFQK